MCKVSQESEEICAQRQTTHKTQVGSSAEKILLHRTGQVKACIVNTPLLFHVQQTTDQCCMVPPSDLRMASQPTSPPRGYPVSVDARSRGRAAGTNRGLTVHVLP